jgi:molybdate-binding protein
VVQKAHEVAQRIAEEVVAGRLAPGDPVPAVRALARQADCSPGTAARAHALLRRAGVTVGRPRTAALVDADGVARALAMNAQTGSIRLSGSDDPALDMLTSAVGGAVERAVGGRGSVAGLSLLAQGAVDVAAVHLRDAETGRCNDPFVRRALGGEPAMLVHLWSREQGLLVAPGNPLRIRRPADLHGRRLAWRAPGTGSRLMLRHLLREANATPHPDGEPCESHVGVAAAVATGAVDAGLAVRSAAAAIGTEFVPVGWEDFELAVAPSSLGRLVPLLDVLASTAVRERLQRMSGYDLRRSGESRLAA